MLVMRYAIDKKIGYNSGRKQGRNYIFKYINNKGLNGPFNENKYMPGVKNITQNGVTIFIYFIFLPVNLFIAGLDSTNLKPRK